MPISTGIVIQMLGLGMAHVAGRLVASKREGS